MRYQKQAALFIEDFKPLPEYPGRKGGEGVYQKIISEIPRCELFIEAMAGSSYISSLLHPSGCSIVVNDCDRSVIDKIRYAGERIEFHNTDYSDIVKRFDNGNPGRIFFFDPPYMMETRSYQGKLYNYDWQVKDHNRFLKIVTAMKCPVLITHYPCPLYDKTLKKWRKITYTATNRSGPRDERLYMNFQPPALLQCYKYVGDNFTDRQRIKRKVTSLKNKLKALPDNERAAILSCIIDEFDYIKKPLFKK